MNARSTTCKDEILAKHMDLYENYKRRTATFEDDDEHYEHVKELYTKIASYIPPFLTEELQDKFLRCLNKLQGTLYDLELKNPAKYEEECVLRLTCRNPHCLYKLERFLERTQLGSVWVCKERSTGDIRVAKLSLFSKLEEEAGSLDDPIEEAKIMRELNEEGGHPNVLRIYDEFMDDENEEQPQLLGVDNFFHWLIIEYCGEGDLFTYIQNTSEPNSCIADGCSSGAKSHYHHHLILMKQALEGIMYMHSLGVAHMDIKPENMLLTMDESGEKMVKICDFGMVRRFRENPRKNPGALQHPVKFLTTCRGTRAYMAPLVYRSEKYDPRKADSWSMGVVMATTFAGTMMFTTPHEGLDTAFKYIYIRRQLSLLLKKWDLLDRFTPELIDTINQILSPDDVRPFVDEILKFRIFIEMD